MKAISRKSGHHSTRRRQDVKILRAGWAIACWKESKRGVNPQLLMPLRTRKSNRCVHCQTASGGKGHIQPPFHRLNILKYSLFIKNCIAFLLPMLQIQRLDHVLFLSASLGKEFYSKLKNEKLILNFLSLHVKKVFTIFLTI